MLRWLDKHRIRDVATQRQGQGTAEALEQACTALTNLLNESDERRAALVQAGATPVLRDRLL